MADATHPVTAQAAPSRIGPFLRTFGPFLGSHRPLVFGIMVGLIVEAAFLTFLSMSLKVLVDQAIMPQNITLLWRLLGVIGASLVLAAGVMLWRDRLYAQLGTAVIHDVRRRLFEHLQTLSLSYFAKARAGSLLSRFSTDLGAVEQVVVGAMPNVVSALLTISFLFGAMLLLNVQLALIASLALPICWLGPRLLLPAAARAGDLARTREAEVLGAVQENLSAQATLKAFGGEREATRQFRERLDAFSVINRRFNFLSYVAERLPNISVISMHVVILGVGAHMAFAGSITVGTLVAFHALLLSLSGATGALTANLPTLLHAATGMRRISEVLEERPAVVDRPGVPALAPVEREIRFEDVTFGWDERPILRNLTLTIPCGRAVAFVGPSGSGKSTALGLLARFHDPDSGRITFDGTDLRDARLDSLRGQMSVVLQQGVLMEMTVRENIRLALPAADDAAIEDAAALAEADTFIRALPAGYDTRLGAGGVHLSGGQRQRIAIAQALVRQPRVLLLDEATSALDPGTERALSATLARRAAGRTSVMVTHNLEQARSCDRVFVFDAGRLAEEGAHQELLDADGVYAHLWRRQHGIRVSDDLEEASISVDWLAELPLFAGVDLNVLSEVAGQFTLERVSAGQDVVRQGTPGDRFYVIGRGTVSISMQAPVIAEPAEVARLHAGEVFGELSLLSNAPRNATIHTVTDCLFLTLERSRFRHWLVRDAEWERRISALSEHRLTLAGNQETFAKDVLFDLVQKSA